MSAALNHIIPVAPPLTALLLLKNAICVGWPAAKPREETPLRIGVNARVYKYNLAHGSRDDKGGLASCNLSTAVDTWPILGRIKNHSLS